MNQRTRIPRRSRRTMAPVLDQLESRQLLSTAALPMQAAAASTAPSFQVVAQFNNASFSGTVAIADKDIWAVGSSNSTGTNEPLAVHFNGMSWSAVPTPAVKGGSLSGVAAVASHDVWAVGSTGSQSLIEHWDGTSWNVVSSPKLSKGGSLTAVTAISTNDVWAVGLRDDFSGDLVEHWDGTSWSIVSSPAFTGASDILRGISADANNDVWAVGDSFSVGGAVILHFDGTSWSRVGAPSVDRSLLAVTVLSSTNAWAAGARRDARHPIPKRGSRSGTARAGAPSPARTRTPGAPAYC